MEFESLPKKEYSANVLEILEIPSIRRQARPIDVQTYHWMGEHSLVNTRTELLRGVIVEKMSKSPLHEYIANELFRLAAKAAGDDFFVRKEGPLTLADSEPEPDLSVVKGRPEDFRKSHPSTAQLVVEVAVSSAEVDREKAALYAEANVSEFWLVLPEAKRIEVFSQPVAGAYQRHEEFSAGQEIASRVIPALVVSLSALFAD